MTNIEGRIENRLLDRSVSDPSGIAGTD